METLTTAIGAFALSAAAAMMAAATIGPAHSAEATAMADKIARGKYLTTIAGCNDCHTPFKLGANGPEPDMERMLSGHPQGLVITSAPDAPKAPWVMQAAGTNTAWAGPWGVSFTANLTPDAETGLGRWTLRNFMDTIRSGRHLGRGRPILPPMPWPMYKNMTDADLEAVYGYLQTIPAVKNKVPEPLAPAPAQSASAAP